MLKDVIGPVAAEALMNDLEEAIETAKVIGVKEMRPWQEFFAVFKPPKWTPKDIEQRMTANMLFYRSNYLMIVAAIFALRIIFAPVLFLCIVLCAALSVYLIAIHKAPIVIGTYRVDAKTKSIACGIFSFIFLTLCGALEHLLWGLIISILFCGLHMMFKPRSVSSNANKAYEEFKINSWFSSSDAKDQTSSPSVFGGVDPENPDLCESTQGLHAGLTSVRRRTTPPK